MLVYQQRGFSLEGDASRATPPCARLQKLLRRGSGWTEQVMRVTDEIHALVVEVMG